EVTDTARKVPAKWGEDEETGDIEASITGIANLSPDHPVQKTIASWPYPPTLKIHSVIGDKEGAGRQGGTDGTVAYESAHLDEALSEKVVRSGHSVQQSDAGIAEVRRILLEHLRDSGS
ncbi:MAG: hypothetical protein ACYTGV_07770, partial [Planctomycetota bacterium]